MFKAALFIVTSKCKQPRCPSVGKWVNRARYIHTVEHYLAMKRDELLSHKKMRRNLKYKLLSKSSHFKGLFTL